MSRSGRARTVGAQGPAVEASLSRRLLFRRTLCPYRRAWHSGLAGPCRCHKSGGLPIVKQNDDSCTVPAGIAQIGKGRVWIMQQARPHAVGRSSGGSGRCRHRRRCGPLPIRRHRHGAPELADVPAIRLGAYLGGCVLPDGRVVFTPWFSRHLVVWEPGLGASNGRDIALAGFWNHWP
jgi:hypothetical protein